MLGAALMRVEAGMLPTVSLACAGWTARVRIEVIVPRATVAKKRDLIIKASVGLGVDRHSGGFGGCRPMGPLDEHTHGIAQ